MSRQLKNAKRTTFNLSNRTIAMIDEYSELTSIPKTAIVEKAIESYLKDKLTTKECK